MPLLSRSPKFFPCALSDSLALSSTSPRPPVVLHLHRLSPQAGARFDCRILIKIQHAPPPGSRLDRTQSEIIRITLAIRRLYAQSDAKVTQK